MSGYTESGEGYNATATSRKRARLRDANGKALTQRAWIVANIDAAGPHGLTQDEARAAYRSIGIQDSTYTGSRSGAHQSGLVVTLAETRGEQAVYVTPPYVLGRKVEPFHPNSGRARRPSQTVLDAADRLGEWMRLSEGTGLLVMPPDYDDLRTIIEYTKGTP